MEEEITKLRENTGSVTGNLRALPVGEEYAVQVPHADVLAIRSLVSQINKRNEGINAGFKLTTAKTDNGIKVWRIA